MQTKVGDIFRNSLNGSEYIVKKIANKMALLESKNDNCLSHYGTIDELLWG